VGSKLVFDPNSSLGVLHFDELRFRNPGETVVKWRESKITRYVLREEKREPFSEAHEKLELSVSLVVCEPCGG